MKKLVLLLFGLGAFTLMSFGPNSPSKISKNVKTLSSWMEGHYKNKSQARKDTNFQFREMHIVEIWSGVDKYASWLFEETLSGSVEGEIVRQRFYRLSDVDDKQVEIQVYTLFGEDIEAYEWQKKNPFEEYTPDDLDIHSECSYIFTRKSESKFEGATYGKECMLDLNGANYVTSEMTIYETKIYRKDIGIGDFEEPEWGSPVDSKGYYYRPYDIKAEMKKNK